MKKTIPVPCPEWEEQLAATQLDGFSSDERAALEAHTHRCERCAAVLSHYYAIDRQARFLFISDEFLRKLAQETILAVIQENSYGYN